MKTSTATLLSFAFASGMLACSGASSPAPSTDRPAAVDPPVNRGTTYQALSIVAPCTAAACGGAPSSSSSSIPSCQAGSNGSGVCGWTDPDPNAVVSYSECAPAMCGPAPGANVCPGGTLFKGSQCGSENDGPCRWTTACVPPPSTTPCPSAKGCGGAQPAIGVICADGSNGEFACMKVGATCEWQRTCE